MNPWRLEWLRMTRSPRGLVLIGVYLFFGLIGPLIAKFLPQLAKNASAGMTIIVPPPRPADGIINFVNQAGQTGLIVMVAVAAGALSLDGHRGLSIFHRTKARTSFALIWPRYAVSTLTAILAYLLGTAAAWYETTVVLGGLPPGRMLLGAGCEALFLAFAVAVVAAAATFGRGTLSTVGICAVVLLLVLPLVGTAAVIRPWLPTSLLTAPTSLVTGGAPGQVLRAVVVAVVSTLALLALAVRRAGTREV